MNSVLFVLCPLCVIVAIISNKKINIYINSFITTNGTADRKDKNKKQPVETLSYERRRQMRFIPIGVASESEFRPLMNASDFSDDKYDGIELRENKQNSMVLIMHNKKTAPMEWRWETYGQRKTRKF